MKKRVIYVFIIILFFVLLMFFINFYNKAKVSKNFNEYVITLKKQKIYDKSHKSIGYIDKDVILNLDLIDGKYFKIKDTNYYIYYDSVKKSKKIDVNNKYYITKKVTTNPTILYKNNEEKINIKEKLEFDVLYSDSDFIYVYFMNDIYGIKDNYEIVESKNEKLDSISFISLGSNLSNENLKQYLDYLNTNNYNTITIDEFNNWKNSYIDFPLNTILLIDEGSHTDLLNEYNYKYELLSDLSKYNITNDIYKIKKTDKNYYKYVINNDTTMDDFINAINGIKDSKNQEIAVLNYHFFYEEKGICNESICLDMDIFRDELKYLNDNNYKTLTIDEFVDWYYGKISLPDNSVLLTIDDGAYGTSKINGNFLIPALEEYDLHATLFLITSWWDIENYRSNNLDIQSHGNDIHFESSCGYQIKCLKYDELLSDFKKSLDIVKSNTSFCFPFYVYTNNAISALEELDFKVAFVGGNKKASRSNNKYKIPRYVILDGISMNEFIGMIN